MEGIKGRVHVITGGYGGIASATAAMLAQDGGIVVLTGRKEDEGQARAAQLREDTGGAVHFVPMDVSDAASVQQAVTLITGGIGPVHGLVVNAATAVIAPALDHTDQDWRNVMATNLDGAFYCARSFANVMKGAGGSIVLVSSIAARSSTGPHLAYSASKAAVSHMARVLGIEWAPLGLRLNAVEPGHTLTGAIEHLKRDAPEMAAQLEDTIPLGRFLRPDEIGQVIRFLLSDLSSAMTGSVVVADGGYSVRS